ncbi:leucine-rich repeat-containing protein 74B-like [Mya arenaria]|uniref:leucine-rich repeat-containing protein 74B-like n=1 Tax=Mya arenaria TaxID=6604 RepID=UPI0022E57CCB|nr:leucine-rich repeat-containing protein 74B-like [Mya arenaria]
MPEQGSADSASYVGAETKRRKNLPPTVEERQYNQICSRKGVTTSGCFARQLNDNVADVSYSMLGPNDIRCISVALKTNVTIKDLDLTGNDLSGKGALYLAKALEANSTVDDVLNDSIENLVLAGNEIDTFGGSYIGKALCSNVGLRRLDLSWNHIRREAAVAICSALKFNTTLEDLDLSWNGLFVDGCRALGHALPHNHTMQHLSLASSTKLATGRPSEKMRELKLSKVELENNSMWNLKKLVTRNLKKLVTRALNERREQNDLELCRKRQQPQASMYLKGPLKMQSE